MFYVFTLLSQLTHSILHDYAIACHWVIVIGFVTHDCESHDV